MVGRAAADLADDDGDHSEAGLTGDRQNVYHAVAVDPLTAALCTLDQARSMTDELFAAHSSLLPGELTRRESGSAPRESGSPQARESVNLY